MVFSSHQREVGFWFIGTVALVSGLMFAGEVMDPILLVHQAERAKTQQRIPASVMPPQENLKRSILNAPSSSTAHPQGKGGGPVVVSISSLGQADGSTSTLDLEASIEAHVDSEGLEYIWILPEGVTITKGLREGILAPLPSGHSTIINVSVSSASKENKRIHLHVFKKKNGEAFGTMAQFNTVKQDEIEEVIRTKAETLNEMRAEGSRNKIMM